MSAKNPSWAHQPRSYQPWRPKKSLNNKFFFTVALIIVWMIHIFHPSPRTYILSRLNIMNEVQKPHSNHEFVSIAYQTTLESYDPTLLQEYCAAGSWNTSKAVSCDRILGGISDSRQTILSCLRYAIKSGIGFIIPTIYLRPSDPKVQESTGGNLYPFGHSFNEELLISRLNAACPDMPIYTDIKSATKSGVEILHFSTPPVQKNICENGPVFAENFGSLLTFPTSVYRLAFSALQTLRTLHPSMNPSSLSIQSNFLGAHLKPSSETTTSVSTYERQSKDILSLARFLENPVIYVASGDSLSVFHLMVDAAALSPSIKVFSKYELLSGNELEELQNLTWDQAALVDHVILQSAGFFAGLQESTFSWGVAMARAKLWGGGGVVCGQENRISKEGREGRDGWRDEWRDEWSILFGHGSRDLVGKLWP